MQYRRTLAWMTLVLVTALVLSGCAPRVGAGETVKGAAPDVLVVDLPALALDVAADGSLSFGGIPLAQLAGSLGLPADLALPADQVKMLTDAGVQHIQVDNRPTGLAILINGQEIPSVGWDQDQLKTVGAMLPGMPAVATLLPVLTQLGVGVTLRLPVAEGAEVAPLEVAAAESAASELAQDQQKFIEEVQTQPKIVLPLNYAADGTWTLGGAMSGDELASLTGQDILKKLNHTAKQMAFVKAAGIRSLTAEINPDGLMLSVNGVALPSVDWSGGKLASIVELARSSGMLNAVGLDPAQLQSILNMYVPMLTSSDIKIEANYPAQ